MGKTIALALILLLVAAACSSEPEPTPPRATASLSTPTAAHPVPTPTTSRAEVERLQAIAVVGRFVQVHEELDADWEALRQGFEVWRQGLTGCEVTDRQEDLAGWVIDFQPIVQAVTGLGIPSGASEVRVILASAVQVEERGLRALRDEWTARYAAAFVTPTPTPTFDPSRIPPVPTEVAPSEPAPDFESTRTQAAIMRQQALARLAELVATAESGGTTADAGFEPTPTPTSASFRGGPPPIPAISGPSESSILASPEELYTFQDDIVGVAALWDDFHRRFDAWQRAYGECPQALVRGKLREFVAQFQGLAGRVSALERPSVVRPLGESLIDAAAQESQALEVLRDSWQPYDLDAWVRFRDARSQVDLLRRQVRSSLDELALEYGLP